MAAADSVTAQTDAYGRSRDEFDDPAVVTASKQCKGRIHDLHDTEPRPACFHGSRDGTQWAYVERRSVADRLEVCSVCSDDPTGYDHASKHKDCPFCDESVKAVNWPDHIRQCGP